MCFDLIKPVAGSGNDLRKLGSTLGITNVDDEVKSRCKGKLFECCVYKYSM